jgi:fibronectin type 3 domain-containing protein
VKLTWKKSAGAAKYRVLRKTGKGKWVKVGDTTKLTFVDKKAKKGVKYTYTVRCVTKNGKSFTSGYNTKGLSIKRK